MTPFTHPAFRASAVARIALTNGIGRDGVRRTHVTSADRVELFLEIDERNEQLHLIPQQAHSDQRISG